METQVIVRIDSRLKQQAAGLAKAEGKSVSLVIRELLEKYVKDRDMSLYLDDLWTRIGNSLKDAGKTHNDVEQAIRDVRKRS
ncbi:MAG: CopG family transcriptional regulator [Gammaproteobacteria bacterium]|nr:CopG family transcriptional regulator [Gammaproteobacteria bacterium]